MEKEQIFFQMEISTSVSMKMVNLQDMVNISGQMEIHIQVIFNMEWSMVKVNGKKNQHYLLMNKIKLQINCKINMMDIMSLIKNMDMVSFNGNLATDI